MPDSSKDNSKYQLNILGLNFTFDTEPYVTIDEVVNNNAAVDSLQINIADNVKTYPRMYYTTNLETFRFIMSKLTLRCSSLTYANLNDPKEKVRVGIEQFAGRKFITCFSHIDHELVPFWMNYGGTSRTQKILLKFKNFTADFNDSIHTDYALLDRDKKVFFESEEFRKTINQNGPIGQSRGLIPIHTDYDLRNSINRIDVFDVEYLPPDDSTFSENYSGEADIDFTNLSSDTSKP